MDRKVRSLGAVAVTALVATMVAMTAVLLAPSALHAQEGDPYTIETMNEYNGGLKALWMDIQVEQIEVLTLGEGRSSSRLHRQPFRWVPGDPRRGADGSNLTYLVDQAGISGSGLAAAGIEASIDHAMASWSSVPCFSGKVGIVKRRDGGADPDIFDGLLGYGGFGDYRLADIVHAGWMPPSFFDAVNGEGSAGTVLAFSVTFIYIGPDGKPADLNADGYLDTAANEIYYNQGFAWLLGSAGSGGGIDLETVALHELGHSLGIGHIGAPLEAVMNPVYSGVHRTLNPLDGAALCSVWGTWPK
ncbi:MAG: matrixin family metalloprotease [Thermoanaerobaculia bacterium]